MSDFNADGPWDYDWNDRGELAWNEFDWERYLRDQDDAVRRYVGFYESCPGEPNRIDLVAGKMGWEPTDPGEESAAIPEEAPVEFADDGDIYTLHKNPVFIATKAIYLTLKRRWEQAVAADAGLSPSVALSFLSSLHRGEEQAVQAVHALDFGDYAMAVSLFKRALSALNESFAQLNADSEPSNSSLLHYRELATPALFDLREIWLRVTAECREELERPMDDEG
jgi:hypothetical protein